MNDSIRLVLVAPIVLVAACYGHMSPGERCQHKYAGSGSSPQESEELVQDCIARWENKHARMRARRRGELPSSGGPLGWILGRRQQPVMVSQSQTLVVPPAQPAPPPLQPAPAATVPVSSGGELYDCMPGYGGAMTCTKRALVTPAPPERVWGKSQ